MSDHPKFRQSEDGTLRLNFGEYGQEVEVASVSGDGRRVLTVREVGTAEVWDVQSGTRVGILQPTSPLQGSKEAAPGADAFEVFIESAALNTDGTLALLGLNDGTAGVFRVSDGTRLSVLHPPGEPPATQWRVIRAVAYSSDGTLALVGFGGRRAGVWTADGRRAVAFLRPLAPARVVGRPIVRSTLVSSVAASPDNRFVFAGCADMTASLWDVASGELVFEALEHAEDTLAVFDDGTRFGWVTTAGNVWLGREGEAPRKVLATGESWAEVVIRGEEFLACGKQGDVSHWTLAGARTSLCTGNQDPEVWSDSAGVLGLDEKRLHYLESDKRLAVHTGATRVVLEREKQLARALLLPGRNVIALAGGADEVELWSSTEGRQLRTLPVPGGVGALASSADGRFIASGEIGHGGGAYPRHVFVHEVETGKQRHKLAAHEWQVRALDFSPDGSRLASLGSGLVVWKLGWLGPRIELQLDVDRTTSAIQFLPDGRLLVLDKGLARIFRGAVAEQEFEVPFKYKTPWCLGPGGRTLTLGERQGVVRIELGTGKHHACRAPIPRYEQLPSRELEAQATFRTDCALWRTAHGLFSHQSDGPRGWVQPAHLSADGRVVMATKSGAVVVDVRGEPRIVAQVLFEGRLRASRVVGGYVLLVSDQGQVLQVDLPGQARE
jgi:WD40 repeat protein